MHVELQLLTMTSKKLCSAFNLAAATLPGKIEMYATTYFPQIFKGHFGLSVVSSVFHIVGTYTYDVVLIGKN